MPYVGRYGIVQLAAFDPSRLDAGRYVPYSRNHFQGFRIFEDGACLLQVNYKTHAGSPPHFKPGAVEANFQIARLQQKLVQSGADLSGGAGTISLADSLALPDEPVTTAAAFNIHKAVGQTWWWWWW